MRILIAALFLAPAAAFAGGYAIPNENARDLALSQSDTAAQVGPEAIKQNAAALSRMPGLGVSFSDEMLYNVTTWSDPTLGTATLRPKANFPFEGAVSYGNKFSNGMAYGLGLGFMLPGGGSLIWPDNWPGAGRIQSVAQKVYLTQLGFAVELVPGVRVAASALYYRVTEELSQQLNFISSTGTAALGLAGNGLTYGLSGEFKLPRIPVTLGIDYRHQAPITLQGTAHIGDVPPNFASALQDQAASEAVTVPNDLYIGAAADVGSALKVMGSWNLERWKSYRSDTYIGSKGLVISVPRNYNNAYVFRLGAEYSMKPLTLRIGGLRSISNQPTSTVSPTLTDGPGTALSAGVGFNVLANLRVDVGYQYAFFDKVTATGIEAFPGSYDTHVHLLSAGVTWQSR